VEVQRTLVKSPPELWEELSSEPMLRRRLGDVTLGSSEAPSRIEWSGGGARGVIELEPSGWGTRVRASAETGGGLRAFFGQDQSADLERSLRSLLDDIGAKSLTRG
jgi:hypothetical protein